MATKININTKQLHADIKALKDDIDASMRERLVIQCGYEELAGRPQKLMMKDFEML